MQLAERFDTAFVPMMTEAEARACVAAINGHMNSARALLLDLYDRRGWKALGYASWRECAVAEFEQGQSQLYRELQAAQIERHISPAGEIGIIPARVVAPLAALTPMEQPMAWQEANERSDGRPSGPIVAQVVREMLGPEDTALDLRFDPTQHQAYCEYCDTTHGDWVWQEEDLYHWVCQRCHHATGDEDMQIVEEPEPETIDYGASELDSNEWYTPVEFIEAARVVMGGIDTDPASNDTAQAFIQAGEYYTKETNGLAQKWGPNVWLNPPYAEPLPWIEKLLAEFEAGHAKQAVLLVNTANSPQWSRLLWHSNFAVCLLDRRVRFWRPDRVEAKGTAQDQMIWYIGYETEEFRKAFEAFGAIR